MVNVIIPAMRLPLLILSISTIGFSFQTANLQNNFTIANAANTMKRLVEELYDPNDLSSCMGRLVADLGNSWAFTPEETAAMEEEKARPHEYVQIHTKEEVNRTISKSFQFIALIQSRVPTLYSAVVTRLATVENIISKLDPDAEQFIRMLWEDVLEMFVVYAEHVADPEEFYPTAILAFKEVLNEYQQLSQEAKDSMDEVLCLKSIARAFPTVVDAITSVPEKFDQCMAQ